MSQVPSQSDFAAVTIRVSGQLFQGHLSYLDKLLRSATKFGLWPHIDLGQVVEVDRSALLYLLRGKGHDFDILSCPDFLRERMLAEQRLAA
jgi:hypothetical protein